MSLRDRLTREESDAASQGEGLLIVEGRVHHAVVARLAEEQGEAPAADPAWLRGRVAALARELCEAEEPPLHAAEREQVVARVVDDVVAFGPITSPLADPAVTEIMVNGPGAVYVERAGRIEKTPHVFRDARHVMTVVDRILGPLGRRVDESSPMADARLPDGSRVNIIIPPVSLNGPVLTARKFRDDSRDLADLEALGALTTDMSLFLKCCVVSRRNLIVSGGTGSGKTTLLNALSRSIPANERIITIEDAAELKLRQGHVLSLESRPPNLEGKGAVTIRDLLRNALRMRPDRIIIGEVRGGEALDLLMAMNTGHDGCLSTLHANAPRDALARLETMTLMGGLSLPVRVVREQIAASLDLVVHLERFEDGSRRVARVAEVHGMEGDVIVLQDVFAYERTGVSSDGRVQGQFVRSSIRPRVLEVFGRFGFGNDCWRPDL